MTDDFWSNRFHWCALAAGFLARSEGRLADSGYVQRLCYDLFESGAFRAAAAARSSGPAASDPPPPKRSGDVRSPNPLTTDASDSTRWCHVHGDEHRKALTEWPDDSECCLIFRRTRPNRPE